MCFWALRVKVQGKHENGFKKETESLHSLLEKHNVVFKLSVFVMILRLQNISYSPLKSEYPTPPRMFAIIIFKFKFLFSAVLRFPEPHTSNF